MQVGHLRELDWESQKVEISLLAWLCSHLGLGHPHPSDDLWLNSAPVVAGLKSCFLVRADSPALVPLLLCSNMRPTSTALCGLGGILRFRLAQSLGGQLPSSFFPSLTSIPSSNFLSLTSHLTAAFPEASGAWACRPGNLLPSTHFSLKTSPPSPRASRSGVSQEWR